MNILIAGGGNHIGAHIYVALHNAGYRPVIVDHFSRSCLSLLRGLRQLLGQEARYEAGELRDEAWLQGVVRRYKPVGTIHIGEPARRPPGLTPGLRDLQRRMDDLITLMRILDEENCRVIQMASSCSVYPGDLFHPIREHTALRPHHIDSHDKMLEEELLRGVCELRPDWTAGILRHFDVQGAHPSGCIGESVAHSDKSLLARLIEAARDGRSTFRVQTFEGLTPDGSAIRDFVHVQDLAEAHAKAIDTLLEYGESFTVNVGTGRAHSVLELMRMVEHISGRAIPWTFDDLPNAESAHCVADTELCTQLLSWRAQLPLEIICADAWRWHIGQPPGYPASA